MILVVLTANASSWFISLLTGTSACLEIDAPNKWPFCGVDILYLAFETWRAGKCPIHRRFRFHLLKQNSARNHDRKIPSFSEKNEGKISWENPWGKFRGVSIRPLTNVFGCRMVEMVDSKTEQFDQLHMRREGGISLCWKLTVCELESGKTEIVGEGHSSDHVGDHNLAKLVEIGK